MLTGHGDELKGIADGQPVAALCREAVALWLYAGSLVEAFACVILSAKLVFTCLAVSTSLSEEKRCCCLFEQPTNNRPALKRMNARTSHVNFIGYYRFCFRGLMKPWPRKSAGFSLRRLFCPIRWLA